MSQPNPQGENPRKVIGYCRTKLPGTYLEGPLQEIFEEPGQPARKFVGWFPSKMEGTWLVGPYVKVFEDEIPPPA